MLYRVCWWIGFFLCKGFFRLKAFGAGRVPAFGPVILAGNHCSYADPVFVGIAAVRELRFLAKREAFDWPLLGPLIRRLNALPVRRGAVDLRALSAVEEALSGQGAVLMFPEGTRRKDGRLGQARPGIGFMAARTRAPIVPFYISGTARIFRTMFGPGRVVVRFGEPVHTQDFPLSDNHRETYQRITDEVMRRIAELKECETADGRRQK